MRKAIHPARTYHFPRCFGGYNEKHLQCVRDCGVNVHCEACIEMSTWTKEDFEAFDRGVEIDKKRRSKI